MMVSCFKHKQVIVLKCFLYVSGYNWCIEVIKNSNLSWLANELEWNKSLIYLRQNDFQQSIETLQLYERKSEDSLSTNALINLSFIYINVSIFIRCEKKN